MLKKMTVILALILTFCLQVVQAEELFQIAPIHSYKQHRWKHVTGTNNICVVKTNDDNLTDHARIYGYNGAMLVWSLYASDYATFTDSSFSESNCDLYSKDWPTEWGYALAMTLGYDESYDLWTPSLTETGVPNPDFDRYINYVTIYVNDELDIMIDSKSKRVISHEFGHVLGMGHNEQENSLMYIQNNDPYLNSYDLNVLNYFYRQTY